MEISNTGIGGGRAVSPISDQDLVESLLRRSFHDLRPKSSASDSGLLLLRNQTSTHESRILSMVAESVRSVEAHLLKSVRMLSDEDEGRGKPETEEKQRTFWEERMYAAMKLAEEVESKVEIYVEWSEKKKRELQRRVVSLTEENRDISGLLRVALLEKEVAEKKLKGLNEQKRLALLQRVGLGFGFGLRFGSGPMVDDGSECSRKEEEEEEQEEADSVVTTIEKTMKNLRCEISQLRSSLEESRSENERLQRHTAKQADKLRENASRINGLETRERLLAQNVDELVMEMREAEAEVSRWREACELEVEAGRNELEERNRVISILKAELEKARSALAISEGKLKLKEELAKAAMAAEEAAEKSLRLADRRAGELLRRIEQLTRQLEEAESVERSRRKLRHKLCWPWPWRAVTAAAATTSSSTNRYIGRRGENMRGTSLAAETRALLRYGA